MSQFDVFVKLHNAGTPVLVGNSWDVNSARLLEENGFKAIATSSVAVALSLGYEDGEKLPFDLLLETVKRIKRNISVPFSVDLEKGYSSNTPGIIQNIEKLYDIGVVGINLEDSLDEKTLQPADQFEKKISSVANYLSQKNMQFFINARTDAFLLQAPDALKETKKRINMYESAGASGIFVPFVREENDITEIVETTVLPLNVLSMPLLPGIEKLSSLGVRRISLGSSLFRSINREIVNKIKAIQEQQSLQSLF